MPTASEVVNLAGSEIGKPYVYGDEGPNTFDCSGLVYYVFGKLGITLPRTAHEQQAYVTPVDSPRIGDLVFYGRPAHHVGIYIGQGVMIDAPDVNQKVRFDRVGKATSYGRVTGVSGQPASDLPVLHPSVGSDVGGAVVAAGKAAAGALLPDGTDAKNLVFEALFVLTGLGLVALGLTAQKRSLTRDE